MTDIQPLLIIFLELLPGYHGFGKLRETDKGEYILPTERKSQELKSNDTEITCLYCFPILINYS